MVNTDDFIKRLELILEYYGLNASAFADKIGVQRSSLSHLLSGRNKPSLDFILKILEVFPDVDLYWILNGKGSFPKKIAEVNPIHATQNTSPTSTPILNKQETNDLFSVTAATVPSNSTATTKTIVNEKITIPTTSNEIDKIVIFYKNGTFKDYKPLE
jgi:transcriptional regulator with XRE-family HTH domain